MSGQTVRAEDVRSQTDDLRGENAFSPYAPLLGQLSQYFLETLASDLDGHVIKETEMLLGELKMKSYQYGWDDSLQDAIQTALGPAGKMSMAIKGNLPSLTGYYADQLVDNAYHLGSALYYLSYLE